MSGAAPEPVLGYVGVGLMGGPMVARLVARGVEATEVGEHFGMANFAFSDPEGRWFAVTNG